jgi:mannosyl-3-phosphoglycerate phosphatase
LAIRLRHVYLEPNENPNETGESDDRRPRPHPIRKSDCCRSAAVNPLIFTDLDGTLLDHDGYSYEAAGAALERLRRRRIPMIIASSKTRAEIERLQAEMRIREPFIPENGAAVFFPEGYRNFEIRNGAPRPPYTVVQLGVAYREVRRFFCSVKERFGLKGFGDLSVEEIARLTGLPLRSAAMARMREFTEPFLIDEEARAGELAAAAASQGFAVTAGGRFLHLIGSGQDKGRAARLCARVFEENTAGGMVTVGLGDSANDLPMLESVDIPVLIPHDDGSYEAIDLPGLIKAGRPGSRGWNEALIDVLDRLPSD